MIEDYIDFHIVFITIAIVISYYYITESKRDILVKKNISN